MLTWRTRKTLTRNRNSLAFCVPDADRIVWPVAGLQVWSQQTAEYNIHWPQWSGIPGIESTEHSLTGELNGRVRCWCEKKEDSRWEDTFWEERDDTRRKEIYTYTRDMRGGNQYNYYMTLQLKIYLVFRLITNKKTHMVKNEFLEIFSQVHKVLIPH